MVADIGLSLKNAPAYAKGNVILVLRLDIAGQAHVRFIVGQRECDRLDLFGGFGVLGLRRLARRKAEAKRSGDYCLRRRRSETGRTRSH